MIPHASPGERKAVSIVAMGTAASVDPGLLAATILADFERYVVGTLADPRRGVDRIEYQSDAGEHFFIGYSRHVVRLLVSVRIDQHSKTAEVTLRATKGDRDALASTDWGAQGREVGNSLLVARTFHVGLVALRRGGVHSLINHPYDSRVRARYAAMGFIDGERIDLTSLSAIVRPFDFIAEIYSQHGLDLFDLPP